MEVYIFRFDYSSAFSRDITNYGCGRKFASVITVPLRLGRYRLPGPVLSPCVLVQVVLLHDFVIIFKGISFIPPSSASLSSKTLFYPCSVTGYQMSVHS